MLVCVTGEVGSGKTEVIKIIKRHNYHTFVMDDYVHQIYKKNKIGYQLIKKHFGSQYVNSEKVNRKKLGKFVFSNLDNLKKLNRIMIPIIQAKIEEIAEKSKLFFIELGIYIYYKKQFSKYFDKVIYVNRNKKLKNKNFQKKIPYSSNFPTFLVGKLNKAIKTAHNGEYIIVENHENLKKLQDKILRILKKFLKQNIL
jgi:dephospho-CoA kinase